MRGLQAETGRLGIGDLEPESSVCRGASYIKFPKSAFAIKVTSFVVASWHLKMDQHGTWPPKPGDFLDGRSPAASCTTRSATRSPGSVCPKVSATPWCSPWNNPRAWSLTQLGAGNSATRRHGTASPQVTPVAEQVTHGDPVAQPIATIRSFLEPSRFPSSQYGNIWHPGFPTAAIGNHYSPPLSILNSFSSAQKTYDQRCFTITSHSS